ncbi:hypothetical protein [Streptomyces ehimensis]|uniref:Uncharacterized protein n=1 Tax=Streptomyces ehimensis TaxID=68195 RepID=A0ABV9BEU2_9ACTN
MPSSMSRRFPTPFEEARRRADLVDARNAQWPSVVELEAGEAEVRAMVVADYAAAVRRRDRAAADAAMAEAVTFDLLNPGRESLREELAAAGRRAGRAA